MSGDERMVDEVIDVVEPDAGASDDAMTAGASSGSALDDIERAVAFRLAGQLYGLPIDRVDEIQQLAELLPVPDDDPALVGLIELRGSVIPVLDLRVLVGLERAPYTLETPMVFCAAGSHRVCLIVDSVEDVVDLPPQSIQPPAGVYALADRMLGTVRLAQGVLMLLDVDRLVPAAALVLAEAQEVGAE